jgi:AraC-like DNA-binding protein
MDQVQQAGQPCYSARLLRPFLEVIRDSGKIPEESLTWASGIDPEDRVHVSTMHTMLELACTMTGDALLGLKAAQHISMGDVGIFDFVLSSAETVRAAMNNAGRYQRLLNDTVDFTLEENSGTALARLETRVILPTAAEDFRTAGFVRNQSSVWPEGMLAETEVWFRHALPADLAPYQEALGPVRLHFDAPLGGISFPARYLDMPLRSRDAKLHDVLVRYADASLAALPQPESVTEKVRRFIATQLARGGFSLEDAARVMRMSSRTLGRRLADEGTTFKNLVDDVRKTVALRYVAGHDLGLAEVALLSGFTETPSFYRAFRRWTSMTPSQYRWTHRGDLRGFR